MERDTHIISTLLLLLPPPQLRFEHYYILSATHPPQTKSGTEYHTHTEINIKRRLANANTHTHLCTSNLYTQIHKTHRQVGVPLILLLSAIDDSNMGQIFSSLWGIFSPNRPYKLLILGLNNAGKTSILYHLQLGHTITTQPTLGGNTEQLTITNATTGHAISFTCWDLGGQEQLRSAWSLYYEQTDAVMFVLDAADPARFPAAKKVLHTLLTDEPALKDAVLLVMANKQDLESAASPAELIEVLELGKFKGRTWTLMGCSAATGAALREGMGWIAEKLNSAG